MADKIKLLIGGKVHAQAVGNKITFHNQTDIDAQSGWSVTTELDLETFVERLLPIMVKHAWWTPQDCQERACINKLARYA